MGTAQSSFFAMNSASVLSNESSSSTAALLRASADELTSRKLVAEQFEDSAEDVSGKVVFDQL